MLRLSGICRVLVVFLIGGGLWLILGCQGKARTTAASVAPPKPAAPATHDDTLSLRDYTIVYPETGPRLWVAHVRDGSASSGARLLTLHGVDCTLYQNGSATLHVLADTGKAALEGNNVRLTLTGHVRATQASRGVTVTADTFRWLAKDNRVETVNVRWHGEGFDHRADRGAFTTDLSSAMFSGHVRTATAGVP